MRLSIQRRILLLTVGIFGLLASRQPIASAAATLHPVLVLREGMDGAIGEWSGPAKFVLYDDGTVITETSNETSASTGEPSYFQTHLTPAQSKLLTRSLDVKQIIGPGSHKYGQGEGLTWQLI